MAANNRDLCTTLKNTSGGTMFFPFLPPQGQSLTANQTFSFYGDIFGIFNQSTWSKDRQIRLGFANALIAGALTIMRLPGTFVFSNQVSLAANPILVLELDAAGTLVTRAPSFQNAADAGTAINIF